MRWVKLGWMGVLLLWAFCLVPVASYAKTPFAEGGVVRQQCSVCHKLDQQERVEVIEETRKSPEEWMVVVERMIRINGAPIADKDFHPVIKELSRHLILTPAEMAQVAYLNSDENSQYREVAKDEVEQRIFAACVRCHTFGKIQSHRKTKEQWLETLNLHLGYYPTVVGQLREMDWPKEARELIEVLAQKLPMDTEEWQTWIKNRKDQDISGRWKIAGYQPGVGYCEGHYTFKANPEKGQDEYLVEKEIRYQNGITLKMSGEGTLFGAYHLRYALAPTSLTGRIEGVFDWDAGSGGFNGKWWTLVQDTNAYGNEMFFRTDSPARVFATFPRSVKADGKAQKITAVGVNLPGTLKAADIGFSDAKLKVQSIGKGNDSTLSLEVVAAAGSSSGPVAIKIKGVACEESLIVYDKMQAIRIYPALGRARVSSGAAYPPQGVQFVARGVHFGKDGQPETDDDLILEAVPATWWLEEEKTADNDDDLTYLKASILNGLYTPQTTYGPIESRAQRREGTGLIAVGAAYKEGGQDWKARARLGVTVPDFIVHIK